MTYLNALTGLFVDGLMWPFESAWPALAGAALATAVLMLLVIRAASSPTATRRAKDRLMARVLELVLFRHDAQISFTAGGRILVANLAYLRTLLWPVVLTAAVCLLMLPHLACWFAARPLRVGEAAVVEVTLRDELPVTGRSVTLTGPAIVRAETPGIRIPRLSEIDWRLRGERDGDDWIELVVDGEPAVRKNVVVGDALRKVSQRRAGPGFWNQFLHPGEPPIDHGQSVTQIVVRYPARQLYLGSLEVDWLLAFFVLTVVFGLVLKRPMRVQL